MAWNPKFDLDYQQEESNFRVSKAGLWQDDILEQVVPEGFITNLADVTVHPKSHAAGVIHDYMYYSLPKNNVCWITNFVARRRADRVFRRVMKHEGVPFIHREILMFGLRLFGGLHRRFTRDSDDSNIPQIPPTLR